MGVPTHLVPAIERKNEFDVELTLEDVLHKCYTRCSSLTSLEEVRRKDHNTHMGCTGHSN